MSPLIDTIVDVSVTANTTTPARKGFGVPGLVAYFPTTVFPERVREYSSLQGMLSDGHLTSDAAYLMAVALKSQNKSVKKWKVCRKALPTVQSIRITPTITTEGEVLRLTIEGTEVAYTILAGATVASICTALAALYNAITGVSASDDTTHVTLTPKNVASATLTVDGVANNETYTVTIDGTDYAFTSDATATATEIRDGLQALIIAGGYAAAEVVDNGVDALDFDFASHAGADLRESATGAATMALSAEVLANRLLSVGLASNGLTVKDLSPDPGIATDWAAIILESTDFYGVGLDSLSEAEQLALAALVQTQKMIMAHSSIDTENKSAATTTDLFSDLKAALYSRSLPIQSELNSQYSGLAWLGKLFPKDPGSATYAFKQLSGVNVSTLTTAERSAIEGKNANHYTEVGGVNITWEGKMSSGEFADIIVGVDWFQARLQERIYALKVQNDKLAYEDAGEAIRAEILAQLQEGQSNKLVAPNVEDTPWVVTVPEVGDISAADKGTRTFPDVEFSAYLSGAVHRTQIVGVLSL